MRLSRIVLLFALAAILMCQNAWAQAANKFVAGDSTQARIVQSWLDYNFDAAAPMGDARNPAVLVPPAAAELLGNVAGSRRVGDAVFVPAAEFQKIARQPLAAFTLGPLMSQLSNIKSFDGFNAVDMMSTLRQLPSELIEVPDAMARQANNQNPSELKKVLRNGDIVFGSHVINYMTWGRFNHVGIVLDAERGVIAESTASPPGDTPGVRMVDWNKFVAGYAHVAVARLKSGDAERVAKVLAWVAERKGRPYRWPIIQGLDKLDQSRFYCSQLVWLAFKDVLDLDLDVDKGVLVFPDDIYYSKDLLDVIVP